MPTAQPLLPLPRNAPVRLRSVRRTFTPSPPPGSYRLPHDARDRLAGALTPYRNRDAAYDLAVFLARFHSAPSRLARTFVIDRRALAGHGALELTEARVRGAIRVLTEVSYLDRAMTHGSPYQPTPEGLRRKPVEFQFAAEFASLFVAANRRARAARERRLMARPLPMPVGSWRPPTAAAAALPPAARPLSSPKGKMSVATVVYSGDQGGRVPRSPHSPALERALDRWKRAFEREGGIKAEP